MHTTASERTCAFNPGSCVWVSACAFFDAAAADETAVPFSGCVISRSIPTSAPITLPGEWYFSRTLGYVFPVPVSVPVPVTGRDRPSVSPLAIPESARTANAAVWPRFRFKQGKRYPTTPGAWRTKAARPSSSAASRASKPAASTPHKPPADDVSAESITFSGVTACVTPSASVNSVISVISTPSVCVGTASANSARDRLTSAPTLGFASRASSKSRNARIAVSQERSPNIAAAAMCAQSLAKAPRYPCLEFCPSVSRLAVRSADTSSPSFFSSHGGTSASGTYPANTAGTGRAPSPSPTPRDIVNGSSGCVSSGSRDTGPCFFWTEQGEDFTFPTPSS
mmetsp:Transcript_210/g.749  ORF Transcript_210/g.749 Transcript_210/m.749 type:complete len:339 (-) Transcript_210:471-1487(-)